MNVYFAADLHLGHKNIINFGDRNWAETIDEHDVKIMERWNATVKKMTDIVWVLGDVAFTKEALDLLRAFNGEKRLIMGNHDTFPIEVYQQYFTKIYAVQNKYHGMVMTHIPVHPGELGTYRGWQWNIHGHIHDAEKEPQDHRYINVNYDVRDCYPVNLEQIREEIKNG
jgi:calcineurin-like phosphoesterase family protein